MNRNVESHFSTVPSLNVKRSVFDRSFSHMTTFNVGQVVPILTEEVLPGDTVKLATNKVVRLQTLLSPFFGNMYLDTYYFFVPNRLVWEHWVNFMGQNDDSPWIPQVQHSYPTIGAPAGGYAKGTIADHMGFPIGIDWAQSDPGAPSSLPFKAYALIMDHFFRDQNLQDPIPVQVTDSKMVGLNSYALNAYQRGGMPFIANKYHDYFTSCLPAPQKGPDVNIGANMRLKLPVLADAYHGINTVVSGGVTYDVPGTFAMTDTVAGSAVTNYMHSASGFTQSGLVGSGSSVPHASSGNIYVPNNLWAYGNLTDSTSDVILSVTSLRLAVQTQMYYEALARAGSRYEEQIYQFFGVKNSDARLQHPEYLGGNRIRLNVHEVTNTAQAEQDFLGDLGAKSATSDSHFDFTKSFTEHGWLIGVCVVRYDHTYAQGMPAKYTRTSQFEVYNPLFAQIGEQPVFDRELYATSDSIANPSVFGYQEAWASYRYSPNMATGLMRPNLSGSFDTWSLADSYDSKPTLSAGWVREDKGIVNRVLAVTDSLSDQVFADFYFDTQWTRCMPMFSVPGAIGAF